MAVIDRFDCIYIYIYICVCVCVCVLSASLKGLYMNVLVGFYHMSDAI